MASGESNEALKPLELGPDVEAILAFRVVRTALKWLVFPVTVFLTLAGFVGWDYRGRLVSLQEELDSVIPTALETIGSVPTVERQLNSLVRTQTENLERQRQEYRNFSDGQNSTLGRIMGLSEARRGEIEELKGDVQMAVSDVAEAVAQLDSALENLDVMRAEINSSNAVVQRSLDRVLARVYGVWSFVIHEKRLTELASIPLSIQMSTIRGTTLREFEVLSNGEVVSEASDFLLGEPRCVKAKNGSWFRITPTYIVELFLGADIAGLHVERRESLESCLSDNPRFDEVPAAS